MKTETKHTHTKGPWTYYMTISDNGPVPQVQTVPIGPVGGAYATMICTLSRTGQKSGAGEANARLIAAAPDLLAALRECITDEGAHCLAFGRDTPTLRRRIAAINERARAAIAKAEGTA